MQRDQQTAERAMSIAHIAIEVRADGRISIRSWYGEKVDAIYAPCTVEEALRRQLPEVLGEAVAYVQSLSSPAASTTE